MSSSMHWSPDRLHADTQRAVGGTLNLIRELSRISAELDCSIAYEWIVKRAQFLAYELEMHLHPAVRGDEARLLAAAMADEVTPIPESERLAVLNRFFFEEKKFCCSKEMRKSIDPSESLKLAKVLVSRIGGPKVLGLLYAFLADRIGIQLEFVDLKPTCFLKWNDQGRSRYIDITREGATLSSDELIENLQTVFEMTSLNNASLLETFSFESYLADYLGDLKRALDPAIEPEKLLFLQNTLIAYQPSNLHLLGERAILHSRLGNSKSALNDLKRYFAFHDRERAPVELVKLFDELNKRSIHHRAQVDPST